MLSATPEDLRRLVAADWWEWMPGMLVHRDHPRFGRHTLRVQKTVEEGDGLWLVYNNHHMAQVELFLPIPSDPATAGCLMELYLRQGGDDRELALTLLGQEGNRWLGEYASLGDFLVAVLLEDDDA